MSDETPAAYDLHHLKDEEVDEIIHCMEGQEAVIVGGQALGIWCDYLFDAEKIEEIGGQVTSKDMDYFGNRELAVILAEQLGGRVEYPNPEDHATPQAAIVLYERDGRTIQIDIMAQLAGLSYKDVMEGHLPLGYGDRDDCFIKILHPFDVLRSRISGVITLRRRDPSALRQLRIAPHVLIAFMSRMLNDALLAQQEGDEDGLKEIMREAQHLIRQLIHLGASSDLDRVFEEQGVDLLAHALELEGHPAWHAMFRERQIAIPAQRGMEARERRIAERKRKDPGSWGAA